MFSMHATTVTESEALAAGDAGGFVVPATLQGEFGAAYVPINDPRHDMLVRRIKAHKARTIFTMQLESKQEAEAGSRTQGTDNASVNASRKAWFTASLKDKVSATKGHEDKDSATKGHDGHARAHGLRRATVFKAGVLTLVMLLLGFLVWDTLASDRGEELDRQEEYLNHEALDRHEHSPDHNGTIDLSATGVGPNWHGATGIEHTSVEPPHSSRQDNTTLNHLADPWEVRECASCGTERHKRLYTERQWDAPGGKCTKCTSGGEHRVCSPCGNRGNQLHFSTRQWRLGVARRCKTCIEGTAASHPTATVEHTAFTAGADLNNSCDMNREVELTVPALVETVTDFGTR